MLVLQLQGKVELEDDSFYSLTGMDQGNAIYLLSEPET